MTTKNNYSSIRADSPNSTNEPFTYFKDWEYARRPLEAKLAAQKKATSMINKTIEQLEEQKNYVYRERNALVAALSKLFPASLERHPETDPCWEDDWRWIVFLDLPTGQASWHIHNDELPNFSHLARETGRLWDGHTNETKYRRLANIPLGTVTTNETDCASDQGSFNG